MKRQHSEKTWLRKLSALVVCLFLVCLTSLALAQDSQGSAPPVDEDSTQTLAPVDEQSDDQSGTDEATASADEPTTSDNVFGQHTAPLYRGRLARR